jgi:bacillithiol system protein YtxJ
MNWIPLKTEAELNQILTSNGPAVIYKHSTRCSISLMAFRKLKMEGGLGENYPHYIVDVIQDRPLSQHIAQVLQVQHESPQILLVKDGACIYNASHEEVSFSEISELIA